MMATAAGRLDPADMNGAQALLRSLVGADVDVCFMNPGTSEMHFVQALDAVPAMRGVLTLFEGVATGAADGYARIAGRPAAVLLHLGAGLSNGLANLHNARRAHSPVLCIVGEHATDHLRYDSPLQSDIEAAAGTVSGWVCTSGSTGDLAAQAMDGLQATGVRGGQVATLILPADVSWNAGGVLSPPLAQAGPAPVDLQQLAHAADALDERTVLLIGGAALTERGLRAASRIAAATNAKLVCEPAPARMEGGAGVPNIPRLPYDATQAAAQLAGARRLVLAGARSPVSFFAYPGQTSDLVPDACEVHVLAEPGQDVEGALEELADHVAPGIDPGTPTPIPIPIRVPVPAPTGALTADSVARTIAATLPADAIVVDEAVTASLPLSRVLPQAARHSLLTLTGGAIGQGLPVATGAAIAAPGRRVLSVEGDGSAMYTIQALWTQARERLDVTTVVINNSAYAILRRELARTGAGHIGSRASRMLDLDGPTPSFVDVAHGFGVTATRAGTVAELREALQDAYASSGPRLIEAMVPVAA